MDTSKWTKQLDEISEDFREEFGELTEEQLNWKPNAETWSVAQNMDHLMVINNSYIPVIESIRNGTYQLPWMGKFNFVNRLFGKLLLNSVHPNRKRKMKTFPIWEPTNSQLGADILQRFEQHQQQFSQLIETCADLLDNGTVISSPANNKIVYKLETAFDIIVLHERRHFEQAKELLQIEREL